MTTNTKAKRSSEAASAESALPLLFTLYVQSVAAQPIIAPPKRRHINTTRKERREYGRARRAALKDDVF